jgi:hypothetical protein
MAIQIRKAAALHDPAPVLTFGANRYLAQSTIEDAYSMLLSDLLEFSGAE